MNNQLKVHLKVRYHHGTAENGLLDLYDASESLQGLARALSITTHAVLNDGEIKKKANSVRGADIFVSPSRKGSFEELITIVVASGGAVGASVVGAAIWDGIKLTWSKCIEKEYLPTTPTVRKLVDRKEPFIGEIEEALESPLEQFHRPIKKNRNVKIAVSRPRSPGLLLLDSESLDAVSLKYDDSISEGIVGNVTRYNILSGFGRMYVDHLDKTVSFMLHDTVTSQQKEHLTWSLDDANRGNDGKLVFSATSVLTAKNAIKRYIVKEVSKASILKNTN